VTGAEPLLVLAAGFAAGTINAVIGSGTLITFPVLLAVGYPPVVANVSNTLGLVPGAVTAAVGYREDLAGHARRVLWFAAATTTGAVAGAALLLALPEQAFKVIVPVLIAGALVLVVFQPRIAGAVVAKRDPRRPHGGLLVRAGVLVTGVYGGYFGAGQGVLLFALLGIALPDDLRHVNALRNLLAGLANAVAAVVFLVFADVALAPAGVIAVGASVGGVVGSRIGRRLSPGVLRALVVVVGLAAIAKLTL
jgi:uncharacterized membrane protein YfcA